MSLRAGFAVAALWLAVPSAVAATSTEAGTEEQADSEVLNPPSIRWSRAAGMLRVVLRASAGAHLAEQLPVEVRLRTESGLDLSWREPVEAATDRLRLVLPMGRLQRPTQLQLQVHGAVCNDDASLCLPFHATGELPIPGPLHGKLQAKTGSQEQETLGREPPSSPIRPSAPSGEESTLDWFQGNKPGQFAAALTRAASEGRPVLVDVFARWCPPCNRLRDEFLEQPQRKTLLQRFVLLSVDADDAGGFEIKERYEVGGYPTVLVLEPSGQLIDRIVGFPGAAAMAARLEAIAPSDQATAPEAAGLLQEARTLSARGRWADAWAQLSALLSSRPGARGDAFELLALAVEVAAHAAPEEVPELARRAAENAPRPGLAAAYIDTAAIALRKTDRDQQAATLIADFEARLSAAIGARSPVVVEVSADRRSLTATFVSSDPQTQRDLATAAWYRARWTEGQAARDLYTEAAVRSAAELLFEAQLELPADLLAAGMAARLAEQPGPVHDLITALTAADLPTPALELCRAMVGLFPEDYTWHYRLAGLLLESQGASEALAEARLAYQYSYGDNRLRAAGLLGEILHDTARIAEARQLLERSLSQEAPAQDNVRTHRYRRKLQELLQTWHDEQKQETR